MDLKCSASAKPSLSTGSTTIGTKSVTIQERTVPVDTTDTTPIPPPADPVHVDRAAFETTLHLYGIKTPAKLCHSIRKVFKSHLLNIAKLPNVVKSGSKSSPTGPGIVLLSKYLSEPVPTESKSVLGNTGASHADRRDDVGKLFCTLLEAQKQPGGEELSAFADDLRKGAAVTDYEVQVSYRHCSIEHVLRHVLPEDLQAPSSFETIGHVVHLNLRSEYTPWKYIIGQVMLDKLQPRIRSVVNKVQNTGGPYRIFQMEVLSGSTDMRTKVRENGCTFEMDFSKVYWNSRLETEHRKIVRIASTESAGEVIADAFCGIGPFAVPILKQGSNTVYANDLNPSSVHYLRNNVSVNGMKAQIDKRIHISNRCAREFLTDLIAKKRVPVSRVLMNFPSGAPEFLDVFKGLYVDWEQLPSKLPTVHCYCFIKGELDTNSARKRVRTAMFGSETAGVDVIADNEIDVRIVRDVAPKKVQVCVTFTVPKQVALHGRTQRQRKATQNNKTGAEEARDPSIYDSGGARHSEDVEGEEPQRKKSRVSDGPCIIS